MVSSGCRSSAAGSLVGDREAGSRGERRDNVFLADVFTGRSVGYRPDRSLAAGQLHEESGVTTFSSADVFTGGYVGQRPRGEGDTKETICVG